MSLVLRDDLAFCRELARQVTVPAPRMQLQAPLSPWGRWVHMATSPWMCLPSECSPAHLSTTQQSLGWITHRSSSRGVMWPSGHKSYECPSAGKRLSARPVKLWPKSSGSDTKTQGTQNSEFYSQLESKYIVHRVEQPVYSLFAPSRTVKLPLACKLYLSPYKLITFRLFLS